MNIVGRSSAGNREAHGVSRCSSLTASREGEVVHSRTNQRELHSRRMPSGITGHSDNGGISTPRRSTADKLPLVCRGRSGVVAETPLIGRRSCRIYEDVLLTINGSSGQSSPVRGQLRRGNRRASGPGDRRGGRRLDAEIGDPLIDNDLAIHVGRATREVSVVDQILSVGQSLGRDRSGNLISCDDCSRARSLLCPGERQGISGERGTADDLGVAGNRNETDRPDGRVERRRRKFGSVASSNNQ